jgi:hypothetical protein
VTRISMVLLFSLVLAAGCGEGQPPCDELAERLCAVADEAFCSVVKEQAAEKRDVDSKQDACRAIIDDGAKLQEILDGTRAATRFQLKAAVPKPKAKPKGKPKPKAAKAVPRPEPSRVVKKKQVTPPARPTAPGSQAVPAVPTPGTSR